MLLAATQFLQGTRKSGVWGNRRRRSTRKKKKSKFNLDRRAANKAALTKEENAELKTLNADTKATRRNSQSKEQKVEVNKKQCVT